MADVVLATCGDLPDGDPDTALLASALVRSGVSAAVVAWDDPDVEWSTAPPTVIRSTWDYPRRRAEYLGWASGVPHLRNGERWVRWNTDKRYLLELAERVPTVPSVLLADPSSDDVNRALGRMGWREGVLKPSVGLDGHGVTRVSAGSTEEGHRDGGWILQPFVREAGAEGEISVVLVEGRPTHAVRRRPPPGDFRAQERLGGRVEPVDPPPATVALAREAIGWIRPTPLYARVDVVRDGGAYRVLELELTEPSLFLSTSRRGLAAMVSAVEALVRRDRSEGALLP